MKQPISTATDVRRFGYYIPKPDEKFDFFVHKQTASDNVVNELLQISSVIFNLQPILFAFDTVEKNYQELVDSIENHRSQLINLQMGSTRPISLVMDGFVIANQKISNFLTSASAFLAQTDAQLRRVHGTNSQELDTWNKKRQNSYANSFSYRFLYELRNFSQHCRLPFASFNIAGERPSNNAPMLFKINAMILRDGFFGVGFNWKKSVEAEIRKQPTEFELLSLTPEYFYILCQLCLEAVQLHSVKLADCAVYFDVLHRTLNIPTGAVPVIFIGEPTSRDVPPSRYECIPIEQFEYVLRGYDKLLKLCKPEPAQ